MGKLCLLHEEKATNLLLADFGGHWFGLGHNFFGFAVALVMKNGTGNGIAGHDQKCNHLGNGCCDKEREYGGDQYAKWSLKAAS